MKIAIIGAGRVGSLIAKLFVNSGDYDVLAVDCNDDALRELVASGVDSIINMDVSDATMLKEVVMGYDALVCACPSHLSPAIAMVARQIDAHYFDLCESSNSTTEVIKLSEGSKKVFIPQCGVSPGFVSIVTRKLASKFQNDMNICIRVGALPRYPANRMKYGLSWDTHDLYKEYTEPCDAIRDGNLTQLLPLTELESISLDGQNLEAFTTANGMGSLCESLDGKVKNLIFKTIRYPQHLDKLLMLMDDFGMRKRADLFRMVMENGMPIVENDVVIMFITVTGLINKRQTQESYVHRIYNQEIGGKKYSALSTTSAAATCAIVDLVNSGRITSSGFVPQEDIDYDDFMNNHFMQSIKLD